MRLRMQLFYYRRKRNKRQHQLKTLNRKHNLDILNTEIIYQTAKNKLANVVGFIRIII